MEKVSPSLGRKKEDKDTQTADTNRPHRKSRKCMQQEEDDYFQSEEFMDILERYEQATASGHTPYMDIDELIDVADYYLSTGKYDQAKEATELALELHPDAEDPVTMMADIMFETQQWKEAIVWLNRVLDNNPFDLQAWVNITDSYLQTEQYAEALDSAEYALAIQPDHPQATLQKAFALTHQERYQEAGEIFDHYLEQCPDDELALYHAAFNLCFLERYAEANKMLTRAEELSEGLSPEHLNICLQRSYTEARLGNLQEALAALERSKSFVDPDANVDYNLLTGHVFLLCGHQDKATEHFAKALSTAQDITHTMRAIAQVFMDCQAYNIASDIFQEIEELIVKPEYEESRADIIKAICPSQAYCYYQTGHKAEYLYYLHMAVQLNPHDTEIFFRDVFPLGARPEDYPYYAENSPD